jgi:hypothetical protein
MLAIRVSARLAGYHKSHLVMSGDWVGGCKFRRTDVQADVAGKRCPGLPSCIFRVMQRRAAKLMPWPPVQKCFSM